MLKHYYQNETDIPDNLKGAYSAKNGRYELDTLADDHPTVETNKSLVATQKTLKSEIGELQQKLTIAESRVLSDGLVAVTPEVKELGEVAAQAGLKKSELPALKTKAAELQQQLDGITREKTIDRAADAYRFNDKFKALAKDKNLNFELGKAKGEDDKDIDIAFVVAADGTKTKLDEFVKTDGFFSQFADTFATETDEGERQTGFPFPRQTPAKEAHGAKPTVEMEIAAQSRSGRYSL